MRLVGMRQSRAGGQPQIVSIESCQNVQIRFAGCPHAKRSERQLTFIDSCISKRRLFMALPSSGIHFDLSLAEVIMTEQEVQFVSQRFLFNGNLARWRGSINKTSLAGEGSLEACENNGESTTVDNTAIDVSAKRTELEERILKFGE